MQQVARAARPHATRTPAHQNLPRRQQRSSQSKNGISPEHCSSPLLHYFKINKTCLLDPNFAVGTSPSTPLRPPPRSRTAIPRSFVLSARPVGMSPPWKSSSMPACRSLGSTSPTEITRDTRPASTVSGRRPATRVFMLVRFLLVLRFALVY